MGESDRFDLKWSPDSNGCHIWHAGLNDGYGHFNARHSTTRAHRIAYERIYGPVPDGLELDHLCRVKACINPDHLEAVTHVENLARQIRFPKIVCPQGHRYEGENLYVDPRGGRRCRECKRAENARYKAKTRSK